MKKKIRVLMAKPGLDGHTRGILVVASALRDAGLEVIYTGLHQTAEEIVQSAIEEDVDVVGLSILSGAHMTFFPKIRKLLNDQGANDVMLIGGGIVPEDDIAALKKSGDATEIFLPGTPVDKIVEFIRNKFGKD